MSAKKEPELLLRSRSISTTDRAWTRYQDAARASGVPFADWIRAALDGAATRCERRAAK